MSASELWLIILVVFIACVCITLAINSVMTTCEQFIQNIELVEQDEQECKIL